MDTVITKINQFGNLKKQLIKVIKNSKLESALLESMFDLDINSTTFTKKLEENRHGIYYFAANMPNGRFLTIDDFGMQWGKRGSKNKKIANSPIYYTGRGKFHTDKLNSEKRGQVHS